MLKRSNISVKLFTALILLLWSVVVSASSERDEQTVLVNGAKLRYIEMGQRSKPVMLFVHGWSANAQYWLPQLSFFATSHRVIAYDWRGMGQSNGGDNPYPFNQLVDDLSGFISQLNLNKPIIVGHSLGGVTALHFAAAHPDVAAAIIAVDAPGDGNFVTGKLSNFFAKALSYVSDERVLRWQRPLNQYFFYSDDFVRRHPQKIAAWRKQFVSNSRTALEHAFQAMAYRQPLGKVDESSPVLLVVGEKDRFISLAQTQNYQQQFNRAQLQVLAGAGHMSTEEQPDAFNQLLMHYLQQTVYANAD